MESREVMQAPRPTPICPLRPQSSCRRPPLTHLGSVSFSCIGPPWEWWPLPFSHSHLAHQPIRPSYWLYFLSTCLECDHMSPPPHHYPGLSPHQLMPGLGLWPPLLLPCPLSSRRWNKAFKTQGKPCLLRGGGQNPPMTSQSTEKLRLLFLL